MVTNVTLIKPLPCIICGKELSETHTHSPTQPSGGVMCSTEGNYGSTVFDPMDTRTQLHFNICDECLVERQDRLVEVTIRTRSPEYDYRKWDPNA